MKKSARFPHESQLELREFSILPGGEWAPKLSGWSLIQIKSGTGYWLQTDSSRLLEPGMVLLVAEHVPGIIRASQLSSLSLYAFNVLPSRLTGLITLGELNVLKTAAAHSELMLRILPPGDPISVQMSELYAGTKARGLLFRLNLLRLFVEIFGCELAQEITPAEISGAKERLRTYLSETPPDVLLEMSFNELAAMTRCTPRHLGRIFHDVVGVSFREKRAEIRLARARELLATSKFKVVDVALESGYKSLSLFNLMFTRRFGTSPGRWRQHHANNRGTENHQNRKHQKLVAWRR